MTASPLLLLGAAAALFLAGVNGAFLVATAEQFVGWFRFKIAAVTLLLIYICLSFTYGDPAPSRAIIGGAGLAIDLAAVFWMWANIERARARGDIGLVPLIKARDSDQSVD